MKRLDLAIVALVSRVSALAQNVTELNNTRALNSPHSEAPIELNYQPTGRDEISTTWEATEEITDAVTGVRRTRSHSYIEIGSGLNYFDETAGVYVPSEDLIELTDDGGAAARRGPARLFLKPNANSAEAITLVTSKGRKFTSRPLGVFWYDARTGASQLIASVQDCAGELLPPNQVVWKGAFGSLGDLRVTYTKSAIEADLILLQQPQLPHGWDASTARIELWEEWTAPGQPAINARLLRAEPDADLKAAMADPDLTDQILDFGDLWFPTGEAYFTEGKDQSGQNQARQVTVPPAHRRKNTSCQNLVGHPYQNNSYQRSALAGRATKSRSSFSGGFVIRRSGKPSPLSGSVTEPESGSRRS
jgi:hypothetical protein